MLDLLVERELAGDQLWQHVAMLSHQAWRREIDARLDQLGAGFGALLLSSKFGCPVELLQPVATSLRQRSRTARCLANLSRLNQRPGDIGGLQGTAVVATEQRHIARLRHVAAGEIAQRAGSAEGI